MLFVCIFLSLPSLSFFRRNGDSDYGGGVDNA